MDVMTEIIQNAEWAKAITRQQEIDVLAMVETSEFEQTLDYPEVRE